MANSAVRLHHKICGDLKDTLNDDSLKQLKSSLKGHGFKAGEISRMTGFIDVWEALQRKGKIRPGNYDFLVQLFRDMDHLEAIEVINELAPPLVALTQHQQPTATSTARGELESPDAQPFGPVTTSTLGAPDPLAAFLLSVKNAPSKAFGSLSIEEREEYRKERIYTPGNGFFLLINQFRDRKPRRKGTILDEGNLKALFIDALKFDCVTLIDKTSEELKKELGQVQKQLEDNRKMYATFVCAIMSHGNKNGIQMIDGEYVPVNDIVSFFKPTSISSLTGKPKVFIIQACRGEEDDSGVELSADHEPEEESEEDDAEFLPPKIPIDCDILIAYSTSEGLKSWRKTDKGSWFIYTLCQVLSRDYEREHLLDMLTEVNRHVSREETFVARYKQMPCIHSQLTKKLYLCPKIPPLH